MAPPFIYHGSRCEKRSSTTLGLNVRCYDNKIQTNLLGLGLRLLPDGVKDSKQFWAHLLLVT